MKHKIEIAPYIGEESTSSLASSRGSGSNKDILAVVVFEQPLRCFLRVISHDKTVVETPDLEKAIEAYNDEP